ncbi:B9 domain-containing protein 1 [Allomyces javanicus]|nr:B9 domain-containing protein 1 [Allomyces javanicus]
MNTFSLVVLGELESALVHGHDALYARAAFSAGPDWAATSGADHIVTSLAHRPAPLPPKPVHAAPAPLLADWLARFLSALWTAAAPRIDPSTSSRAAAVVWNCAVHMAWKTTNVFGWPQVVVAVYGIDFAGRDVLVGYATVRVPRHPGRHVLYAPLFAPLASSPLNQFLSWITGRRPEFVDPFLVARSEGRQVTRVRSNGTVKLVLDVFLKDMEKFGYQLGLDHTDLATGTG